jgi:hypothetical protein
VDETPVFAGVDKGGGHTEVSHVFEHDAVVCCIKCALEVHVHDVDVFFVKFSVPHRHDDGCLCVVDAAVFSESIMLVAENAVCFGVFRACVFD